MARSHSKISLRAASLKESFLKSKLRLCFGFKKMSKKKTRNSVTEDELDVKPRRSQRKRNPVLSNINSSNLSNISESNSGEFSGISAKAVKRSRKKASSKVTPKGGQCKINFCCITDQSSPSPDYDGAIKPDFLSSSKTLESLPEEAQDKEIQPEESVLLPDVIQGNQEVDSSLKSSTEEHHIEKPLEESPEKEELKISKDLNYLITDENPPLSYWENLIKRRTAAIEHTLTQNEQLMDRIAVATTENAHLRAAVEAGGHLIRGFREYLERFDHGEVEN